jgi:hypothetical protein
LRRPFTAEFDLLVPLAVSVWAVLAWMSVQIGAPAPVAIPVAGTFLLFGPGVAMASLLRLRGTAILLTVALAGSIGALILVSQLLLTVGSYRPGLVVTTLTMATLAACGFDVAQSLHGRSAAPADEVRS